MDRPDTRFEVARVAHIWFPCLQGRTAGDGAMCAHQRDVLAAQGLGECDTLSRVADQHVGGAELLADIEHRHAGCQKSRVVEHCLHLHADKAEGNDRWRVAVHDRIDIRPDLIPKVLIIDP